MNYGIKVMEILLNFQNNSVLLPKSDVNDSSKTKTTTGEGEKNILKFCKLENDKMIKTLVVENSKIMITLEIFS